MQEVCSGGDQPVTCADFARIGLLLANNGVWLQPAPTAPPPPPSPAAAAAAAAAGGGGGAAAAAAAVSSSSGDGESRSDDNGTAPVSIEGNATDMEP